MRDLQVRLQLRSTVQQALNDIMMNNQISATDMEDAVEHYLYGLKDAVSYEYVAWAMEDKQTGIQNVSGEFQKIIADMQPNEEQETSEEE